MNWFERGDEVVQSWKALSVHGQSCATCGERVKVLREGGEFEVSWTALCDEGRSLAESWKAAKDAMVERWRS